MLRRPGSRAHSEAERLPSPRDAAGGIGITALQHEWGAIGRGESGAGARQRQPQEGDLGDGVHAPNRTDYYM